MVVIVVIVIDVVIILSIFVAPLVLLVDPPLGQLPHNPRGCKGLQEPQGGGPPVVAWVVCACRACHIASHASLSGTMHSAVDMVAPSLFLGSFSSLALQTMCVCVCVNLASSKGGC